MLRPFLFSHPFLALPIYVLLGLYFIRFGRSAYREPDVTFPRWHSFLHQKDWSRKLLRSFAVFWIFGGTLLILNGIVRLPVLRNYHGALPILIVLAIAIAGSAVSIPHQNR